MGANVVTFVDFEDWVAMYFDGKLVDHYHSLDNEDVIKKLAKLLGIELIVNSVEGSDEWLEQRTYRESDYMPENLRDVVTAEERKERNLP